MKLEQHKIQQYGHGAGLGDGFALWSCCCRELVEEMLEATTRNRNDVLKDYAQGRIITVEKVASTGHGGARPEYFSCDPLARWKHMPLHGKTLIFFITH